MDKNSFEEGFVNGASFVYDIWRNFYIVLSKGAKKGDVWKIEKYLNQLFDSVREVIENRLPLTNDYEKGYQCGVTEMNDAWETLHTARDMGLPKAKTRELEKHIKSLMKKRSPE